MGRADALDLAQDLSRRVDELEARAQQLADLNAQAHREAARALEEKSALIDRLTSQLSALLAARGREHDLISLRLREIEQDARFQAPAAMVDVNAPLALIQCTMQGEVTGLRRALKALDEVRVQGPPPTDEKEHLPDPEETP